jgi:hypothetical protein
VGKDYSHIVHLINPPGWILNPGGPYIALPLLKSALFNNGIGTKIIDANLDASSFFDLKIYQSDLENIENDFSLSSLNIPYFREQNKMNRLASAFCASWDIQLGYIPVGYNYDSSESIREFSSHDSVFTSYFKRELIPAIQRDNSSLLGISITVPQQLLPTFEFCRLLRDDGYEGNIILGGNMITRIGINFNLFWVFELVDGLILFQGENSIPVYYNCLQNNLSFNNVPNLVWKNKGEIITNRIEHIKPNEFTRPDFSDLRIGEYWGNNYLTLLGSRGCYYGKCSFCSIPFAYGNNGFLGHDKASNVFKDIIFNTEKFGIKNFKFTDEALHPKILKTLSEEIISNNVDCNFEGYARLDPFWKNEQFLKLVSKAGLSKVYLGLELIHSDKRNLLNKNDSDNTLEMLQRFNDAGIKVHLFTLFGYPGTSVDEAVNTVHFALQNQKLIDTLDVFPFYYAKHTKVPFINSIIDKNKNWAIEYDYETEVEGVLKREEVNILCQKLEEVIWNEKPEWLHPTYRMISPFGSNSKNSRTQKKITQEIDA